MLRQYIDKKNGKLGCTINTFGFGYSLDSVLLEEIAFEGNGQYAFIPDGSFVGTIFINAMSNFLSTVAKDVTLTIEGTVDNGTGASTDASSSVLLDPSLIKHLKHSVTSWGLVFRFGSVIYGQSKDVLIPIKRNTGAAAPLSTEPYCSYSLKYTKVVSNTVAEDIVSVPCHDTDTDNSRGEFKQHFMRLFTVNMIFEAIKAAKNKEASAVTELLEQWKATFKSISPSSPSLLHQMSQVFISGSSSSTAPSGPGAASVSSITDKYLPALEEDVTGQVTEALTTPKFYNKWGRHYLPSIARAHLYQTCNNFKDPGVQFYGGALFDSLRDRLHDLFCQLPPPTPSARRYSNYNSGGSRGSGGGARLTSMSVFSSSNNPCFHEDCKILMAKCTEGAAVQEGSTTKAVKDVVAGDVVQTEGGRTATILYVLKTRCLEGKMELVHFPSTDLKITKYHPMRTSSSRWAFPCEVNQNLIEVACGAIYSFVLAEEGICCININNTWCVTLGHGYRGEAPVNGDAAAQANPNDDENWALLQHPYFGNRAAVLADMKELQSKQRESAHGVLTITSDFVVRDPANGLICGIKAPATISA